jgi:Mg/Co/Ni transporter MgtE
MCSDRWARRKVLDDVYIEQENVLDKLQYFIEQREMEAAGQVPQRAGHHASSSSTLVPLQMILEAVSEMSHERRCGILKMLHPEEAASALSLMSATDAQQALEDIRTCHGKDRDLEHARREAEMELDLAMFAAESVLKAGEPLSAPVVAAPDEIPVSPEGASPGEKPAETERVDLIEVRDSLRE